MRKDRRLWWYAATHNPHCWYLYRAMGQTYLQHDDWRDRLEPKNASGWDHERIGPDGRWHTETELAEMAHEEARRMGWLR